MSTAEAAMSTADAAITERGAPLRARLGKFVAMLSSERERGNAVAALGRGLADAGLDFNWLARLVVDGELPGGEREKLLARLIADRLRQSLPRAWAMKGGDAHTVRGLLDHCEGDGGLSGVSNADIERAIAVADEATRRAK
jgi:hypothetical protein